MATVGPLLPESASLVRATTNATTPGPGNQIQQTGTGSGATAEREVGEKAANRCPASASGGSVPARKAPAWSRKELRTQPSSRGLSYSLAWPHQPFS